MKIFKTVISVYFCFLLCSISYADSYSFPKGFVWDSTKKYLAPEHLPQISTVEIEPWYRARDNAIKFIEVALNSSASSELSEAGRSFLVKAVTRLKTIKIVVENPTEKNAHIIEGFDIGIQEFDSYDCQFSGQGASVYSYSDDVKICRFYLFVPDDYKTQVLIHESIHLGGLTFSEIQTTMLEYFVMKANGKLPVPNGYINPTNSKEKFSPAIDYSDIRFRKNMHPLRWIQMTERKCKINVEYKNNSLEKEPQKMEVSGSLFYGSPSIFPESLTDKRIRYASFGESTSAYEGHRAGDLALVKRGQTTFSQKMNVASYSKASGIIIYDDGTDENSILAGSIELNRSSSKYAIPTIGIGKKDGINLKSILESKDAKISVHCEF